MEIAATTNNSNDKLKVSNLDRYFPTCATESTSKTPSCYNFADVRMIFESRAVAGPQTASKQFNISVPLNKPLVQNQRRFFEEKSKPETDYNQTSPPSLGQYYENNEHDATSRTRLSDVGPETNVDGTTIEKNYTSDDDNEILTVCRSRANSCSGSDASEELRRLTEANDGHDDEEEEIAENDPLYSCHSLQKRQSSSSSGCSIVGCIPKVRIKNVCY